VTLHLWKLTVLSMQLTAICLVEAEVYFALFFSRFNESKNNINLVQRELIYCENAKLEINVF